MGKTTQNYRLPSKKQMAYVASLCDQLGIINPTLFTKYNQERISKLITRLQKKVDKRNNEARQTKLL